MGWDEEWDGGYVWRGWDEWRGNEVDLGVGGEWWGKCGWCDGYVFEWECVGYLFGELEGGGWW